MINPENEIIASLSEINPEKIDGMVFYQNLVKNLNTLITENFNSFITLLYRLDISEEKFKLQLNKHPEKDAAAIAANLIIERQLQKIQTRRQFSRRDDNISEEEKW